MSSMHDSDRSITTWLEGEAPTRAPQRLLGAARQQIRETPQRQARWPARRMPEMSNALKLALGAAAVVVASLVALNVLGGGTIPMVGSSPSPIPSPSTDSLPLPRLPGMTASPAGEYGWVGGPSSSVGMHKINEQERRPVASLTFGVSPFCLGTSEDREAVPVRVAGFDGVSIEPFERSVIYGGGQSWIDPVTRAYELAVADRFLCVWLAWNATTTADELAAVEDILDTLRAVPVGEHGIRITFTLDEGWDRG